MHFAAIVAHAICGTVAFVAGCVLLSRVLDQHRQAAWLATFAVGLLGMILYMAAAIAAHWDQRSTPQRSVYLGLLGLGIYIAGRGWDGWQTWRKALPGWPPRFVDDIGFNLIALFDGPRSSPPSISARPSASPRSSQLPPSSSATG